MMRTPSWCRISYDPIVTISGGDYDREEAMSSACASSDLPTRSTTNESQVTEGYSGSLHGDVGLAIAGVSSS